MLLNSSEANTLKSKPRPRLAPPELSVPPVVVSASMPLMRTRVNWLSEAAHRDLAAFAGVAGDRDARDALQRLGEVQVREVGDVLGDDGVDHADLAALHLERLFRGCRGSR